MPEKTVWDVLWSGAMITAGVYMAIDSRNYHIGNIRWYRLIGYMAATIGWICSGICRITLGSDDVWPFVLVGGLGQLVAMGVFEGAKLSSLLPAFCRRRGSRS